MDKTLLEAFNSHSRAWKFDSQSIERNVAETLAYAFFVDDRCKAVSTLHLDAALTTLAEFIDSETPVVVRVMPRKEALAVFAT